jgi:hypothetical protein
VTPCHDNPNTAHTREHLLWCAPASEAEAIRELPAVERLLQEPENLAVSVLAPRRICQLVRGLPGDPSLQVTEELGFDDRAPAAPRTRRLFSEWISRIAPIDYVVQAPGTSPALQSNLDRLQAPVITYPKSCDAEGSPSPAPEWVHSLSADSLVDLEFPLTREEAQWANLFLGLHNVTTPPIALASTAISEADRWPMESWVEAIGLLSRVSDRPILFFRQPDDPEAPQLLAQVDNYDRAIVVDPNDLLRIAALLQRCHLFVGCDSPLIQLASAVGTPVLGLYGTDSFADNFPLRPENAALLPESEDPARTPEGTGLAGLSVEEVVCATLVRSTEADRFEA